MIARTDGGVSGFARMRCAVLLFKQPSLCLLFMIVQAGG